MFPLLLVLFHLGWFGSCHLSQFVLICQLRNPFLHEENCVSCFDGEDQPLCDWLLPPYLHLDYSLPHGHDHFQFQTTHLPHCFIPPLPPDNLPLPYLPPRNHDGCMYYNHVVLIRTWIEIYHFVPLISNPRYRHYVFETMMVLYLKFPKGNQTSPLNSPRSVVMFSKFAQYKTDHDCFWE